MKKFLHAFIIIFLINFSFLSFSQGRLTDRGKLEFTENKNQWDSKILFRSDIPHGALFLKKNCFTFNFLNPDDIDFSKSHTSSNQNHHPDKLHFFAYKVNLQNAKNDAQIYGSNSTKDYKNYIIGKDETKWASHVQNFKTVTYKNIYDKIDLVVYSVGIDLKYDYIVYPGGNPNEISMSYEGLKDIKLKKSNLIYTTTFNLFTELKPESYQQSAVSNQQSAVGCKFILKDNIVKFDVGAYDKSKILVIDPQLIFSTYSGSLADNWGFTATYDNENNVYSGGISFGLGYPVSLAFQETFGGGDTLPFNPPYNYGEDIAIIKYDPTGQNRLWATYLGGNSGDLPHSMIVNSFNELLIFGTTGSNNFPMTQNSYNKTFKGGTPIIYDNVIAFQHGIDIFAAKLSADGTKLLGSTYIGGSDNDGFNFKPSYETYLMEGNDSLYFNYGDGARGEIITDNQNNVYIGTCTFSNDFPVTSSAFQTKSGGKQEGVVFKLDYSLSNLIWSSYVGGSGDDAIYSIDVDNNYNLYAAGGTNSNNFPTTAKAYKKNFLGGSADGFIAHISEDGSKLLSSSYFGSDKYDQAYFVRTDKKNNPHIAGQTKAPGSELIYNAPYHTANSGQFIAKLSPELDTLKWSTVFGTGIGRPNISLTAFAVDICNKIYVSGWGRDWPFVNDTLNWDNLQGTKNMDITSDAIQKETDGQDFYVMVLTNDASSLYYGTFYGELHNSDCLSSGRNHVDGGTSRFDKRGNIYESVCASCSSGSCKAFPTYPNPGAWSNTDNAVNCNNAIFKINIFSGIALADFEVPSTGCAPFTVTFNNKSEGTNFVWNFGDNTQVSTDKNPSHLYKKAGLYNVTLKAIDATSCNVSDSITKQLQILSDTVYSLSDVNMCKGDKKQIGLDPFNDPTITYQWKPTSGLSDPTISNPYAFPEASTKYMLLVSNKSCTDTVYQQVNVHIININKLKDTTLCYGGSYKLKVSAKGEGKLQYQWSSTKEFTDFLNSNPDDSTALVVPSKNTTYFVKVTDGGCEAIDSVLIRVSMINITVSKDTTICNGHTLTLEARNNSSNPMNFTWTPVNSIISGANTPTPVVGPEVTTRYYVTGVDNNKCIAKDSVTITVNSIKIEISDINNLFCDGKCDGEVILDAIGGKMPYTWQWSSGQKDSLVEGLCAGRYFVTATDNVGCKGKIYINLSDTSSMNATIDSTNITCFGHCNGSAIANATGASNKFTYQWDNGQTESIATNLCPGIHNVTITESQGCIRNIYFSLIQPTKIIANYTKLNPLLCNESCDGEIFIAVSGGNPPYAYFWNNGEVSDTLRDLCKGDYTLTVTDRSECNLDTLFTIDAPPQLQTNLLTTKTICRTVCSGEAISNPEGGTGTYTYLWSNGLTDNNIKNLCDGHYSLTVTDINSCIAIKNFTISDSTSFPTITIKAEKDSLKAGQSTVIHVLPNNKYTYKWSPSESLSSSTASDPIASPIVTTTYSVTITDLNGCTFVGTVVVIVESVICSSKYVYVPNAFTPDMTVNNILYVRSQIVEKVYLAIYDRWGEKVFETNDLNKGWDGTYNGRKCNPAVFDYYIDATCINKDNYKHKGNITLIR